jgi:hypothetical protein
VRQKTGQKGFWLSKDRQKIINALAGVGTFHLNPIRKSYIWGYGRRISSAISVMDIFSFIYPGQ